MKSTLIFLTISFILNFFFLFLLASAFSFQESAKECIYYYKKDNCRILEKMFEEEGFIIWHTPLKEQNY